MRLRACLKFYQEELMNSFNKKSLKKIAVKKISTSLKQDQFNAFVELSKFADDMIRLAETNAANKIIYTGADFRGLLEQWIDEVNRNRKPFESLGNQKGGDPNIYIQAIDVLTNDLLYMLNYKNSELTLYFVAASGDLWDGLANIVSQFAMVFHGQYKKNDKNQQIESAIDKVLSGFSIDRPTINMPDRRQEQQREDQRQQLSQQPVSSSRVEEIRRQVMSGGTNVLPVAEVTHDRYNLKENQGRGVINSINREVDRRFTPMDRNYIEDTDDDKKQAVANLLRRDYVTPMDNRSRELVINPYNVSEQDVRDARDRAQRLGIPFTTRYTGSQQQEFERLKEEKDNQPSGGGYSAPQNYSKEDIEAEIGRALGDTLWKSNAEKFLKEMQDYAEQLKDVATNLESNIVKMANAINDAGRAADYDKEMSDEENDKMNRQIITNKLKDAVKIGNSAKDNIDEINRIRDTITDNKSLFRSVFFNNPVPLLNNPFSNDNDWGYGNKRNTGNYLMDMVTKNENQLYQYIDSEAYEKLIDVAEGVKKNFENFYSQVQKVYKDHYIHWNQFKRFADDSVGMIYRDMGKNLKNQANQKAKWASWIWTYLFKKYDKDLTYITKFLNTKENFDRYHIKIDKVKSVDSDNQSEKVISTKTYPLRYVRYLALKYVQNMYQEILEDV